MRGGAEFHIGDRVTLDTVGAALQQDELRLVFTQVSLDQRPDLLKYGVIGKWRHRDIQFGTLGGTLAGFVYESRARVERAAILVDIGEDQVGIVLEAVKHAVAVMRIDIDVRDLLDAVLLAQILDGDAAIVEYAKAGGNVAARMMQARDR